MTALYVLLAIVILAAPVIFASVICVPKWWMQVVEPAFQTLLQKLFGFKRTVDMDYDEYQAYLERKRAKKAKWDNFWTKNRTNIPLRWVWAVPVGILALIVGAVVMYYGSVAALIERRCPYTSNDAPLRWDSWSKKRVTLESYKEGTEDFIEFIKEA